jgi:hypothetical protein
MQQSVQGAILVFQSGPAPHVRGAMVGNMLLHILVRLAVAMSFGRHQEFLAHKAKRPRLFGPAYYKHICDIEPNDIHVPLRAMEFDGGLVLVKELVKEVTLLTILGYKSDEGSVHPWQL